MSLVLRTDRSHVATLTLNRPEKLNALTSAVLGELREHLQAVAPDESVRCVVLTGAGRSFSAGHDLSEISSRAHAYGHHDDAETIDLLEQLPQPTIGRIRGHCFTGALELALACDLLVADDTAVLGDTHGQWGLAPIWGMSRRLPERVGRATAKELMFTSRRVSGPEAAGIGLVNRCVPTDDLDATVDALADEIARNSPYSNRISKKLVEATGDLPRAAGLLLERTRPFGVAADREERLRRSP